MTTTASTTGQPEGLTLPYGPVEAHRRISAALRSCVTCGKPHAWTDTTRRGDAYARGTWADPTDGHPYRRLKLSLTDEEAERLATVVVAALTDAAAEVLPTASTKETQA